MKQKCINLKANWASIPFGLIALIANFPMPRPLQIFFLILGSIGLIFQLACWFFGK